MSERLQRQKIVQLKARIQRLEASEATYKSETEQLKRHLQNAQKDNKESIRSLQEREEELKESIRSIRSLQKRKEELKEENVELRDEIDDLRSQTKETSSTKMRHLKREVEARENEILAWEAENQKLKVELNTLRSNIARLGPVLLANGQQVYLV